MTILHYKQQCKQTVNEHTYSMTYAIIQYVGTNYLCRTQIDLFMWYKYNIFTKSMLFVGGCPNVHMGTLIGAKLYSSRRKFTDN